MLTLMHLKRLKQRWRQIGDRRFKPLVSACVSSNRLSWDYLMTVASWRWPQQQNHTVTATMDLIRTFRWPPVTADRRHHTPRPTRRTHPETFPPYPHSQIQMKVCGRLLVMVSMCEHGCVCVFSKDLRSNGLFLQLSVARCVLWVFFK